MLTLPIQMAECVTDVLFLVGANSTSLMEFDRFHSSGFEFTSDTDCTFLKIGPRSGHRSRSRCAGDDVTGQTETKTNMEGR